MSTCFAARRCRATSRVTDVGLRAVSAASCWLGGYLPTSRLVDRESQRPMALCASIISFMH